jgi:hypothetical protein
MKCANPDCNRHIGLVQYRRWFGKQRYCSRRCRDDVTSRVPRRLQEERNATTYFEWLFLEPVETNQPKSVPAVIRRATR